MVHTEVNELKKNLTITNCCIHKVAGCYVDTEKQLHPVNHDIFLSLQEEDQHKYFDLIKRGLSGTIGRNLLNMEFESTQIRDDLLALKKTELKDEQVLQSFYAKIRDSYDYLDNYYILMFYSVYDVVGKTENGEFMEDTSDTVYDFVLTLICPLKPSKAGLMYNPVDNSIENAIRNMMVEPPMHSFLYPAFTDRATDIHHLLYYSKKANELNDRFVEECLGCKLVATAQEQSEIFVAAMESIEETSFDKIKSVYTNIQEYQEEHKDDPEEQIIDRQTSRRLLENSGFTQDEIEVFQDNFIPDSKETETKQEIMPSNILAGKKMKIKTGTAEIVVPNAQSDYVDIRKIDGKNCIVIEINDEVTVNGIRVNKF
ncbi:MAG: DUF4317 domain-containing protein [Wujia sp.]